MTLYINNLTALRFWCMVTTSLDDATSPCSIREVKDATTSLRGFSQESLGGFASAKRPLHVLVGDRRQRTKSPQLVYHVRTKPYPSGAFRRYNGSIAVASPELCFFEMADVLPFFKLVEFGFLLCGTYTAGPDVESRNDRGPLTTKRKLASFIERMGTARGCATARKALALVIEGSASARETKTAILLCTPTKLGGYGLEMPRLNHRIDFSKRERLLFGRKFVVIDLYWHGFHFGLEYDGSENHSEERDVSRDRRKNSELSYHGIEILRVDKAQLANPYQVYVLAKKCSQKLGRAMRKPTSRQREARLRLFREIIQ